MLPFRQPSCYMRDRLPSHDNPVIKTRKNVSCRNFVTISLVFLAPFTLILVILLSQQQASALEDFKIRVWLADVKPDTGEVQLCIDVNTTFASICKKFDVGALKIDNNLLSVSTVSLSPPCYSSI
jgi:hypothetical protein